MLDTTTEEWRSVKGWARRYEVSSAGRVRSKPMRVGCRNGTALRQGRVLTPVVKGGRYLCVTLASGVRRKQCFIHDLVAQAFIGPKPRGQQTRHLDDDKLNNNRSNIAYGTHIDNLNDRITNGKVAKGAAHGMARLSPEDVLFIRSTAEGPSALAKRYGVHPGHIHAIRTRRVWRHI